MLGVTLFGLFLTPVFYVALRKLVTRHEQKKAATVAHDQGHDQGTQAV
jgi:multidrug efflux pump